MKTYIKLASIAIVFCWMATPIKAQYVEGALVEKGFDALETKLYGDISGPAERAAAVADPRITAMVEAVSGDSMKVTLLEMQNWGTRFLMNGNKREIAVSLMQRFLDYGYTDVRLDSFLLAIYWGGHSDSAWQYNVECILRGSSAPDEIYVVGGHWDSYCAPDPFHLAPGVDDNATAVAATLEVARVMKLFSYQPECTIAFTLYAAEELGLFGSRYAAAKARYMGSDLRYMLNMDMISNNPDSLDQVKIYQYLGMEWAGRVAAEATELYTDLAVVVPQNNMAGGSDSFPYWLEGFPCTYYEEIVFSPHWHQPSDTLGNCNIPYLEQVTGGVLATLAVQQALPHPTNLVARSSPEQITLSWKLTSNAFVRGVNIYRSEAPDSGYEKINQAPVGDSLFHDMPALMNHPYYYMITTVNDSLKESGYSNRVSGARFGFCDTLLVLANTKGDKTTPDSVRAFYQAVLDSIPYRWLDVNMQFHPGIAEFSRYRSVLWLSNTFEFEPPTTEMADGLNAFIDNGGNLFFSGFAPVRFWIDASAQVPLAVPGQLLFHRLFGVDSADRKVQSMLCGARAVAPGYNTVRVDSLKWMDPGFPGQLYNIDVFAASPTASVIYRFDSRFDSTTSFGKMKHRPVGIEYHGAAHTGILLSFPLYYLDTADAKNLLAYILREKFGYPSSTHEGASGSRSSLNLYPNPSTGHATAEFFMDYPGQVTISVFAINGRKQASCFDGYLERGVQHVTINLDGLPPGFYEVVLHNEHVQLSGNLIRIH